jgi:hypothetical protein
MALGDNAADYEFVAWGKNDSELQQYGDVYRTVYTGYKPFIPLTQTYKMAVKAEANRQAASAKKGFFQFQPEGSGISAFSKHADPKWGGAPNDGPLSNIAAYTLAREVLGHVQGSIKLPGKHHRDFKGVASDMDAAGKGTTATAAGQRAVALAKELEKIINLDITSVPQERLIKGESIGEVRTQGMVNFLINNQGLINESKFLEGEMKEMLKIFNTIQINSDEKAGGFSQKGFDIGYYSEQDAKTLAYLTQRFRDEFDIPDYVKIVGMEETNMGGKKLFQKKGKDTRIYKVSKDTVQADLQREMDKIMGKVERFIQEVSEAGLDKGSMLSLQNELMNIDLPYGGNDFMLDSPVTLTQEMWKEIYDITGGKGHETLTSFSAQVVDRLFRAYNANIEKGLDGEENSGYMYVVPVTLDMDGRKQYSLVGVHIYGDFQKTAEGVQLLDIQNKVYNLGVFNTADEAMLDTWMQKDLQLNGQLSNSSFQRAAQDYRSFISREMQMFFGSFETIGTQLLLTQMSKDAFQTQINFVSTMTSADMAKSFQDQIEAQLSSGQVSKQFKEFYDKMTGDADDLTKTWKEAVGANVVQDFSKVFKQRGEGAFVKGNTFGIKSGMVWPDQRGIGQSGGFTNRQSGAMEGFAFTPFVDSTKESYYIHSKASVYPSKFGKTIEAAVKDIIKKRKKDKLLGKDEIMGRERIGGQTAEPLMRVLWRNGKLEDDMTPMEREREKAIEAALGHLEQAGLL